MRPVVGLSVIAVWLTGCAGPLDPIPDPASVTAASDAPILPPQGTITSRELVRLFVDNCVRPFPDEDAMRRAFVADGFVVDEASREPVRMRQEEHDLFASITSLEPVVEPTGGAPIPPDYAVDNLRCHIGGDVSDPEAFAEALQGLVNVRGEPIVFDELGDERGRVPGRGLATIERNGATLSLLSSAPQLVQPFESLDSSGASSQGPCGSLPECRAWTGAVLEILAEGDDLAALQAALVE